MTSTSEPTPPPSTTALTLQSSHNRWSFYHLLICVVATLLCLLPAQLLINTEATPDLITIFALHLATITLVGFCFWVQNRLLNNNDKGQHGLPFFQWSLIVSITFTGLFGAIGNLIATLCYLLFERQNSQFNVWYMSLFPEDQQDEAEQIYQQIMKQKDAQGDRVVTPLLELIQFGTRDQKYATLSLISRHFHPSFSPALKAALEDEDNAIRVLAAAAVTKIQHGILDQIIELKKELASSPQPSITLALANLYDTLAYYGLMNDGRSRSTRETAINYYYRYLELQPDDEAVIVKVTRLYMRNEAYLEATQWIEKHLELADRNSKMLVWYMEALYQSKRFDKVYRLVALKQDRIAELDLPFTMMQTVQLWLQSNPFPTQDYSK